MSRNVPLALLLLLLCVGAVLAADAPRPATVDDELRHAETYYWFGMAELGNMQAYAKGLAHLDRAAALLEEAELPPAERDAYTRRIAALRTDLEEQAEIGHDTLYGVFPLFRFFGPSVFADQANFATFELLDEPEVMVTTAATRGLALEALKAWSQRPQLDVVFVSVPRDTSLENEALYVFNSSSKFFVHNLREAVDALPPGELDAFLAGETSTEAKNALLQAFGIPELLVVVVRQSDVVDGDHFYTVEARLYGGDQSVPTHKLAVMGFSRDRRGQLVPIVVTTLLLLAFAYVAFAWIVGRRRRVAVRAPWSTYAFLPGVAFLAGRTAPWLIAPLVRPFAPHPENLAIVSFWAPLAAGFALIVLPMLGHWILTSRFARAFPALTFEGRGAAICVAIGAGVVAYLAVPAFLYLESGAVGLLIPLTLAVALMAAVLGRALDKADRLPAGFAVAAMAVAALIGLAVMHAGPPWMWGVAAVALLTAGLTLVGRLAPAPSEPAERDEPEARPVGSEVAVPSALLSQITRPAFRPTPAFEQGLGRLEPVEAGRTARLGLTGGPGSGLSRTVAELLRALDSRVRDRERIVVVMRGRARKPDSGGAPYEPFRQALAEYFEVDLLASPQASLRRIDDALGGLFDTFVPFGSILFPNTAHDGELTSRDTIFASIVWMLRRLARSKTVLLAIDDAQWSDDASRSLLAHLLEAFPAGGAVPLAILVASHDPEALRAVGVGADETVSLAYPDRAGQAAILRDALGLSEGTAFEIVDRVGQATRSTRGMTWLFQVVADLARGGAFVSTDDGLSWLAGSWPEAIDLPAEMGERLRENLERFPRHRSVLTAAACAAEGREFDVETLAQVLGTPRLDLLAQLDAIEAETGLIHDVRSRDDVYAFESEFLLDAVRRELGVTFAGPSSSDVPQIVREYHARVGETLEATLQDIPSRVFAVARQFHAAGARRAEKGMRYGIGAARAYAAAVDFEGAQRCLARAEECASLLGRDEEVAAHRIALACQSAHVTGEPRERAEAAAEGQAYLDAHPGAPSWLRRAVAQAHYDAGKSTGDTSHFDAAVALGTAMAEGAATALEEAAGRHLIGISLPLAERDRRRAELMRALELVEESAGGDEEGTRLHGRILGSLGEELSRGDVADRERACRLFQRRLELLEATGVGDPKGLAMTHGGLGRLAFFASPRDVGVAKEHFARDLELSEALGDVEGQVQMHSLLGACALEQGHVGAALEHYDRSWSLSPAGVGRLFAGAGRLRCHAAQHDASALQAAAGDVVAAWDGLTAPPPADAVAALRDALGRIPEEARAGDLAVLAERVAARA